MQIWEEFLECLEPKDADIVLEPRKVGQGCQGVVHELLRDEMKAYPGETVQMEILKQRVYEDQEPVPLDCNPSLHIAVATERFIGRYEIHE